MLEKIGLPLALATLAFHSPALADEAEPQTGVGSLVWHSEQQAYPASLKAADGWHFVEGGLRWRWLDYRASDDKPTVEDTVTVHYEGKFLNGEVFDSSYTRGEPAKFPLGRLIKGWQFAIPQMGVGDTIEIVIPADLAY